MNDVLSMNRRRFMTLTGSALATLGGGHALAQGQKRLELNPTEFRPIPIAISNFVPGSPADGDVSNGVTQVITNNLKRSGLFAPIDQAAFIERISNIDVAPQFENWKTLNAQALVTGRMTRSRTDASRPNSACGTWSPASSSPANNISPRRNIGAGSPTSSPTKSMRS